MTATAARPQQQPIRSTIPARLDRLRWTPFHTRLVLGLGTAWVLDGLSVTVASSVSSKLTQPDTLNLTTAQAADIGTVYLLGEVVGALVFGRFSDKLGRRKLFMWTLAVYLVGTALTAFTAKGGGWIIYLYATRFIAGMGIGGEYSAINSAIDEMMPARYRGRTDIWINGTYWLGAILGTFASFLLLNSMRPNEGWRVAFLAGPALAFVIAGAVGPAFYGVLIGNGTSRTGLAIGYVVGGGIMIIGGLVEIVFGIDAEGKPLEQIAAPLTEVDD
jgi:MFS family permease